MLFVPSCALLVILSLLLVIMGGQHDGLFLSGSLSFTFICTCIFFSWQINSAAAVTLNVGNGPLKVKCAD